MEKFWTRRQLFRVITSCLNAKKRSARLDRTSQSNAIGLAAGKRKQGRPPERVLREI
jgi:hypothetical protein